ncbi:hypothetical protein LDENG_00226680 [Lucifuga dentata]|nr:hypothetical protein LDENG_00226680 [Lucifuga dentata]
MNLNCAAGDVESEENKGGEAKRKLLRLKIFQNIWKKKSQPAAGRPGQNIVRKQQNSIYLCQTAHERQTCLSPTGEVLDLEEEEEEGEILEEASRKLILREEELFSQEAPSEEEEDQLQRDFEALLVQIWMAVDNTFSAAASSSSRELKVLQSAVASILQQEEQDWRWADRLQQNVPVWRPQKCLSTHTKVLHNVVESRLRSAEGDSASSGGGGLSSPLKRQVCCLGKRVKEDLLTVVRKVKDCYPPYLDVVNLYAGLYQQSFSARLAAFAASELKVEDCSYLLFWVNHYYPDEILKREELQEIRAACLDFLLPQEEVNRLEERYLTQKEETMKLWLCNVLSKEEESWLSGKQPELIDQYCFTPLAVDVIQVVDSFLAEFSSVVRDQSKAQRLTAHLESFLSRYKKAVEDFVKGNHANSQLVMKANLACVEQFRSTRPIKNEAKTRICMRTTSSLSSMLKAKGCRSHTVEMLCVSFHRLKPPTSPCEQGKAGSLPEQQTRTCLEILSALRDCGYRYFTQPIHTQLKVCYSQLWTSVWLKDSVPVLDSVLDSVDQQLDHFTDLKPSCREVLLSLLHQDVVLQYVKRTMKTKLKNREQQVGGAERMMEDASKIRDFFINAGCAESICLNVALCNIAEILRLQDPGSVQLEMVSLSRAFPDLSDVHVSVLLSLKTDLSAADIHSIRQSVQENRLSDASTNHSSPLFAMIKIKWINKINQMTLKAFSTRGKESAPSRTESDNALVLYSGPEPVRPGENLRR